MSEAEQEIVELDVWGNDTDRLWKVMLTALREGDRRGYVHLPLWVLDQIAHTYSRHYPHLIKLIEGQPIFWHFGGWWSHEPSDDNYIYCGRFKAKACESEWLERVLAVGKEKEENE